MGCGRVQYSGDHLEVSELWPGNPLILRGLIDEMTNRLGGDAQARWW